MTCSPPPSADQLHAIMTSRGKLVNVTVEQGRLCIRGQGGASGDGVRASHARTINLHDIVGCHLKPTQSELVLSLTTWPLKKLWGRQRSERRKQVVDLTFECHPNDNNGDLLTIADQWLTVLGSTCLGPAFRAAHILGTSDRLLIFVNPFSGTRIAMKTFLATCSPILKSANIRFELARTEFSGHARQTVSCLDLSRYIGIVLMSGDGLAFEVLNGLMNREDHAEAIQTPIGILPGGSGNAMCASICYAGDEPLTGCLATTATLLLVKHTVAPSDLIAVETKNDNSSFVAVLSYNWGLIADIDIESEKYRNLGSCRFTLGAILRISGLRKYKAKISYAPSKLNLYYRRRGDTDSTLNEMPSFSDPVPKQWVTLEDEEFILLFALNQTHLSSEIRGPFPGIHSSDGLVHLMVVGADISRTKLLKNMMAMEDGKPVQDPNIHLISATAFRIVQQDECNQGINVLDGELVTSGPLQAHVLPSLCRVMCDSRLVKN